MARKKTLTVKTSSEADVSALLLRLSIGPMLFVHGHNKVWGGGGLKGTTGWFESLGLKPAHVHARLAAGTEMGSGALLTAGALSPLPAAAAVGLMAVAARTDHRGKGFFIFKGGWEYVLVVAGAAVASATLGSGRFSVDRLLGKQRKGSRWGIVALAIGVGNAAALIATSYKPELKQPVEVPQAEAPPAEVPSA
jgi:putative oxidoreductase